MIKMQTSRAGVRRGLRGCSATGLLAAGLLLATGCSDGSVDSSERDDDDEGSERVSAAEDNGTGSCSNGGGSSRDAGTARDGASGADDDDDQQGESDPAVHDGGHAVEGDGGSLRSHGCGEPYPKDPRDDTMTGELTRIDTSAGQYELQLPKEMLDWLDEQGWVAQHGNWHAVRRWDQGCLRIFPGQACDAATAMEARGLKRAPIQEGEPGDGFAFLVMHRHMIQGFHQAFPKHAPEIIRGFSEVPTNQAHPENPVPWINVRWDATQLESIDWMENVGEHLSAFASEDDYAKWVQFGDGLGGLFGGLLGGGSGTTTSRPAGGMHTGLHAQWLVVGSPSILIDNNTNVRNYAFWRLHVWLDDMWQRYREAAGLSDDDPEYQQGLIEQCEEMHALDPRNLKPTGDAGVGGTDAGTAPPETGVFATEVAPIFTAYCGGSVCHGADSPTLGVALTGVQPSAVRQGLVGQPSSELPSLALVEPGEPEQSWLFRKISGDFDGLDCDGGGCTKMPPAGAGLSADDIERIRSWIADGAAAD